MAQNSREGIRKLFNWLMFCILGFLIYMYYPENHFALQYQAAIDCRRINEVHAIAELAERYYIHQGYYPLSRQAGSAAPQAVSVVVSDKALPRSYAVRPPPEIQGVLIPPDQLAQELERVLGEKITLPYDPQTNFAWEKRFYLYKTTKEGNYSVSGTLFSATEYTRREAKRRHSYQVGSTVSATGKSRLYQSIDEKQAICQSP